MLKLIQDCQNHLPRVWLPHDLIEQEKAMKTVPIPYQVQGTRLSMPVLGWPDRCACCSISQPGTRVALHHDARYKTEYSGPNSVTISKYPLVWSVPYCEVCAKHSKSLNLDIAVYILVFLFWAGLGYLLFLMDLAYNTLAIIGYIVALFILGYGSYAFNRWWKRFQEQRARSMMKPACISPQFAVKTRSDWNYIYFDFQNDAIAAEFEALNRYAEADDLTPQ
jgi:hypothetical protein